MNPDPNTCLGVFGLSLYTTERDLREVFSKYGPLTDVCIVYDQQSRRSRGFAFVYFENKEDSEEVCSLPVSVKTAKHGTYHKSIAVYAIHQDTSINMDTSFCICRLKREQMVWSWTVAGSEWTSPSPRGHTPLLQGSTWASPHSECVRSVQVLVY